MYIPNGLATSELRLQEPTTTRSRDPLRVLFIGNSYTYYHDMPSLIGQLAKAAGESRPFQAELSTISGVSLQQHWERGKALTQIKNSGWDYVVLQEQSVLPIFKPAQMHQSVRLFDAEIKQANAQTLLFLTWAKQHRPNQQRAINRAYFAIAEELGANVAPVGAAWQNALAGRPDLVLHMKDNSHPTASGAYLTACVFYVTLYGRSPVGAEMRTVNARRGNTKKYAPTDLSVEEATFLQRIAWETVQRLDRERS